MSRDGGVSEWKITKRKNQGPGAFWLEDRPGWSDITWGMVEDEEMDQKLRAITGHGGGFLVKLTHTVLAKTGILKRVHRRA